jgi:hypothetical protein
MESKLKMGWRGQGNIVVSNDTHAVEISTHNREPLLLVMWNPTDPVLCSIMLDPRHVDVQKMLRELN